MQATTPPAAKPVAQIPGISDATLFPILKGVRVDPDDPFNLQFIIEDTPEHKKDHPATADRYLKLVKYFLTSLTVPDNQQWVNLSPYEKDRMISPDFGQTIMGHDLLQQDLVLKQNTAFYMHPDSSAGKAFWAQVYRRAQDYFGTTDLPFDTFNKIWIVPDKAVIYENGASAFLVEQHLKALTESDYAAMQQQPTTQTPETTQYSHITRDAVKDILLPVIEEDINNGAAFAPLRQMAAAMELATWYKKTRLTSFLQQNYIDQARVRGVDQLPGNNALIYQDYLHDFREGIFNFIREDIDPLTRQPVPRKYVAGGFQRNPRPADIVRDFSQIQTIPRAGTVSFIVSVELRRLTHSYNPDIPEALTPIMLPILAQHPETWRHSLWVTRWLLLAATRAWPDFKPPEGMPLEQFLSLLFVAGMTHDVGKLAISEDLLNLEAMLTPEERRIISEHTSLGATELVHNRKLENLGNKVRAFSIFIANKHHAHKKNPPSHKASPESFNDMLPLLLRIFQLTDMACGMLFRATYPVYFSNTEPPHAEQDPAALLRGLRFTFPLDTVISILRSNIDEETSKTDPLYQMLHSFVSALATTHGSLSFNKDQFEVSGRNPTTLAYAVANHLGRNWIQETLYQPVQIDEMALGWLNKILQERTNPVLHELFLSRGFLDPDDIRHLLGKKRPADTDSQKTQAGDIADTVDYLTKHQILIQVNPENMPALYFLRRTIPPSSTVTPSQDDQMIALITTDPNLPRSLKEGLLDILEKRSARTPGYMKMGISVIVNWLLANMSGSSEATIQQRHLEMMRFAMEDLFPDKAPQLRISPKPPAPTTRGYAISPKHKGGIDLNSANMSMNVLRKESLPDTNSSSYGNSEPLSGLLATITR